MLLIESGSARLLGENGGRLSTLTRLKAGSFVGVASLLRCAPCEEVRAASELVAISISDEKLLELLSFDSSISNLHFLCTPHKLILSGGCFRILR